MTESNVESFDDQLEANSDCQSQFHKDLEKGVSDFLEAANEQLNLYTADDHTLYYSVDVVKYRDAVAIIFKHSKTLPDEVQKPVQQQ